MNLEEIMSKLEVLGTKQTKEMLMRHMVNEPLFGIKIGILLNWINILLNSLIVRRFIKLLWELPTIYQFIKK